MNELDSFPLKFACPKCGKKINKTIGWMKGPSPKCPHCGTPFEASQFRGEMQKADKALADLKRTIANFGR